MSNVKHVSICKSRSAARVVVKSLNAGEFPLFVAGSAVIVDKGDKFKGVDRWSVAFETCDNTSEAMELLAEIVPPRDALSLKRTVKANDSFIGLNRTTCHQETKDRARSGRVNKVQAVAVYKKKRKLV